jgi:hypothetical protein
MTLQNRVTPFGDIVAIGQRGLFTGNRGIIHDPATRTLTAKRWTSKAWLVCACEFRGVRRAVMATRSWTELFFLDEAVALAAGHRPCFFCRREDSERFRATWATGRGEPVPSAPALDAVLHAERLERRRKRLHPIDRPLAAYPDGTMIAVGGRAFTLRAGQAHGWTEGQYAPAQRLAQADWLLTPPSTVLALEAGYRPAFHPSVEN